MGLIPTYISPEKIIDNYKYRDMLLTPAYMAKLAAVIVDEAHCVKPGVINSGGHSAN